MAYSQNDPAWKYEPLGFDSDDPNSGDYGTVGMYGCYVTAIANICNWAGNNLNPSQINQACRDNGWFVAGDLIGRPDIPALLCGNLQFVGETKWSGPTDMGFFDDASDPNVAYIIQIDASTAPGIQTHFVMVWATYGNGDLQIDDSWDGVQKKLSLYGSPSAIVQSATKFVKVQPPAPAEPAPPQPEPPVVVETPPPVPVSDPAPTTEVTPPAGNEQPGTPLPTTEPPVDQNTKNISWLVKAVKLILKFLHLRSPKV